MSWILHHNTIVPRPAIDIDVPVAARVGVSLAATPNFATACTMIMHVGESWSQASNRMGCAAVLRDQSGR